MSECNPCKRCTWNGTAPDRFDWDGQRMLIPLHEPLMRSLDSSGNSWVRWAYRVILRPPVFIGNNPLADILTTGQRIMDRIGDMIEKLTGVCRLPGLGVLINERICVPLSELIERATGQAIMSGINEILERTDTADDLERVINRVRQIQQQVNDIKQNSLQQFRDALDTILDVLPTPIRAAVIEAINNLRIALNNLDDTLQSLARLALCIKNPKCKARFFADIILRLIGLLPVSFMTYANLCAFPCIDDDAIDRLFSTFPGFRFMKGELKTIMQEIHGQVCRCTILPGCEEDDPRRPDPLPIDCDDCANCDPNPSNCPSEPPPMVTQTIQAAEARAGDWDVLAPFFADDPEVRPGLFFDSGDPSNPILGLSFPSGGRRTINPPSFGAPFNPRLTPEVVIEAAASLAAKIRVPLTIVTAPSVTEVFFPPVFGVTYCPEPSIVCNTRLMVIDKRPNVTEDIVGDVFAWVVIRNTATTWVHIPKCSIKERIPCDLIESFCEAFCNDDLANCCNQVTRDLANANAELDTIKEKLNSILARIGEFPFEIPSTLVGNGEGQQPPPRQITSLAALWQWWIVNFDAIMGEFPIPIEIDDTDPNEPGSQSQKIKLPNVAEALAELFSTSFTGTYNSAISNDLHVRAIELLVALFAQGTSTFDHTKAILDYTGLRANEVERELPIPVTLKDQDGNDVTDLDGFRKESKVKTVGLEYRDRDTLQEAINKLLFVGGIIKAVHTLSARPGERVDGTSVAQSVSDPNHRLNEDLADYLRALNNRNSVRWRNPTTGEPTQQPPKVDRVGDGILDITE